MHPHIGTLLSRLRLLSAAFLVVAFLGAYAPAARAQEAAAPSPPAATPPATKTIADVTANSDRHEGLFTVYRDRKSGEVHIALRPDQLNKEYIYAAVTMDGVVEAGHFRGAYRDNRVISLARHFERIELRAENTAFYFDPSSPLSRAASANISPAVLAVATVVAEDASTGEVLIKGDFLLDESLHQVKPTPAPNSSPNDGFRLGTLSRAKGRIVEVRGYPLNTDVLVEYVYENASPVVQGGEEITDARNVSIRLRHTLVAMPDAGYEPRLADYRLGHFTERVTDLTSDRVTPYRDLVQRWHLRKRDPSSPISEPVEPIVWWIENTTPLEYRDTIRDAVLAWNPAFEKAGFRNALVVNIQPDDAEWDAGDVRYNVLRWTSSPQPPFSGYGPSFTNPRTGQILGADIMLEHSGVTRRVQIQRIIDEINGTGAYAGIDAFHCSLGHGLQASQVFGRIAIDALQLDPSLSEQLVHQFLAMVTAHEIGHTLGFTHNFAASQMLSLGEVYDAAKVDERALTGSVMDYTDIHFEPNGSGPRRFFQTRIGPYDDWVVEFAYSPAAADAAAERQRLAAIASRSTAPDLAYGNDADDMRSPGKAVDPRVNVYDMSADPIGYANDRLALIGGLLGRLKDHATRDGESYHQLADAYTILLAQLNRSLAVVSRFIGGVEVNRSSVGQPNALTPFVPIDRATQQRAMQVLASHAFSPRAFVGSADLYTHLQRQRRLFDFFSETEDPKLHEGMLAVQRGVLNHLLHATVLKRVTDTRLYGNGYGLADLMGDLTRHIFSEDLRGDVNTFRQNLQIEYVTRLTRIPTGTTYDYPSQSMALFQLREIRRMLQGKRTGNVETRAHTSHVLFLIEKALDR